MFFNSLPSLAWGRTRLHALFLLLLAAPLSQAGCPFSAHRRALSGLRKPLPAFSHPAPSPYPQWEGNLPASVNVSDPFVAMNSAFDHNIDMSGYMDIALYGRL